MSIKRAVAAPCFADDPMALVDLAVEAEQAGFDGFFLWDHMTWADDGSGRRSSTRGRCCRSSRPGPSASSSAR